MTRQEKNKNLYNENENVCLCLVCGGELYAEEHKNTWIYKHKEENTCPFVGFEYIEEKDLTNLVEHLTKNKYYVKELPEVESVQF